MNDEICTRISELKKRKVKILEEKTKLLLEISGEKFKDDVSETDIKNISEMITHNEEAVSQLISLFKKQQEIEANIMKKFQESRHDKNQQVTTDILSLNDMDRLVDQQMKELEALKIPHMYKTKDLKTIELQRYIIDLIAVLIGQKKYVRPPAS
ncbi:hypothetical protein RF11_13315 [Thelohanellus kitauei]|uniref:Uncharacterized protein n=1 Tax=Thelohanellus kitauei TaxID=669202 RepID=A0A0C2JY26_THEKT|nr:hypothetical protein RF11_13315 [Thelohanellus kitauei]